MQKNILRFILISILLSGLYGCSCSQSPVDGEPLAAGLYISKAISFAEGAQDASLTLDVVLVRDDDSSASVVVDYEISAPTNTTKALATLSGSEADIIATSTGTLTFDQQDKLTILITVVGDSLYELDEVFWVSLKVATGADIIEGRVEVTLINDDSAPVASVSMVDSGGSSLLSEAAYTQRVAMKVSLDAISGVDASFSISSNTVTAPVAAYRIDYMLYQNGVLLPEQAKFIIPAGEQEILFEVAVVDDGVEEEKENFDLNVRKDLHVSVTGESLFSFSIEDNDLPMDNTIRSAKLNDTGLTTLSLVSLADNLAAQTDSELGRDKTVSAESKVGAGRAGFDFSKIASNGDVLDDDTDFSSQPWDCVLDNNTGLTWEVKVPNDNTHIRYVGRRYNWYDPNSSTNGGASGEKGDYICDRPGREGLVPCNTAYYVADINQGGGLCGQTGWRLPTIEEMRSIVDYSKNNYDTKYFAGDTTALTFTWTSTTVSDDLDRAWTLKFRGAIEEGRIKQTHTVNGIRLVNDAKVTAVKNVAAGTNESICANVSLAISSTTPTNQFDFDQDSNWVIDEKTDLMWTRCPIGYEWGLGTCTADSSDISERSTWESALTFVEENTSGNPYLGFSDWRLPNIKELTSIVERQCINPAVNFHVFGSTAMREYWSNTAVVGVADIFVVDFSSGRIRSRDGSAGVELFTRLVRDAE